MTEQNHEISDLRDHPAWNFVFREFDACIPEHVPYARLEHAADNAVQRLLNEGLLRDAPEGDA